MADILMKPSFNIPFPDQRLIQDRRSQPTSLVSVLRLGGRRRAFRRDGEGQNRYVDCLSLRSFILVLLIFSLSTLDAVFTFVQLENGASEINPLMRHLVQADLQLALTIKSLGVGLMAWFLAIHQNSKISFYGMHVLTGIYSVLLVYHIVCTYLLWGI